MHTGRATRRVEEEEEEGIRMAAGTYARFPHTKTAAAAAEEEAQKRGREKERESKRAREKESVALQTLRSGELARQESFLSA